MSTTRRALGHALLAASLLGCAGATDTDTTSTTQEAQDEMGLFKKKGGLLAVGSKAPDFEVLDHHGNTVRLSDFSDKRVLIWFYPKADTPG